MCGLAGCPQRVDCAAGGLPHAGGGSQIADDGHAWQRRQLLGQRLCQARLRRTQDAAHLLSRSALVLVDHGAQTQARLLQLRRQSKEPDDERRRCARLFARDPAQPIPDARHQRVGATGCAAVHQVGVLFEPPRQADTEGAPAARGQIAAQEQHLVAPGVVERPQGFLAVYVNRVLVKNPRRGDNCTLEAGPGAPQTPIHIFVVGEIAFLQQPDLADDSSLDQQRTARHIFHIHPWLGQRLWRGQHFETVAGAPVNTSAQVDDRRVLPGDDGRPHDAEARVCRSGRCQQGDGVRLQPGVVVEQQHIAGAGSQCAADADVVGGGKPRSCVQGGAVPRRESWRRRAVACRSPIRCRSPAHADVGNPALSGMTGR
jgi:hypothetical protein